MTSDNPLKKCKVVIIQGDQPSEMLMAYLRSNKPELLEFEEKPRSQTPMTPKQPPVVAVPSKVFASTSPEVHSSFTLLKRDPTPNTSKRPPIAEVPSHTFPSPRSGIHSSVTLVKKEPTPIKISVKQPPVVIKVPQVPAGTSQPPRSGVHSSATLVKKDPGYLGNHKLDGPVRLGAGEDFGAFIDIKLSHVKSSTDFYVQRTALVPYIRRMRRIMTDWYEENMEFNLTTKNLEKPISYNSLKLWGYYAGKFEGPGPLSDKWLRVLVKKKLESIDEPNLGSGAYCALIDYGGFQFFRCDRLCPLRKIYAELPWGAVHGFLSTMASQSSVISSVRHYKFVEMARMAKEMKESLIGMIISEDAPNVAENRPFQHFGIFIKTKNTNCSFLDMYYPEKNQPGTAINAKDDVANNDSEEN